MSRSHQKYSDFELISPICRSENWRRTLNECENQRIKVTLSRKRNSSIYLRRARMMKLCEFLLPRVLHYPAVLKKVCPIPPNVILINTLDFEPAYNLLIHLILTSASVSTLLPQVISNLATPPSYPQGPSISIAILSTIFNVIPEYPALQFQIFKAILSISQQYNLYDYVSPYFKPVNQWLSEWKVTPEDRTQVWETIISMAEKADDRWLHANQFLTLVNCIICY